MLGYVKILALVVNLVCNTDQSNVNEWTSLFDSKSNSEKRRRLTHEACMRVERGLVALRKRAATPTHSRTLISCLNLNHRSHFKFQHKHSCYILCKKYFINISETQRQPYTWTPYVFSSFTYTERRHKLDLHENNFPAHQRTKRCPEIVGNCKRKWIRRFERSGWSKSLHGRYLGLSHAWNVSSYMTVFILQTQAKWRSTPKSTLKFVSVT